LFTNSTSRGIKYGSALKFPLYHASSLSETSGTGRVEQDRYIPMHACMHAGRVGNYLAPLSSHLVHNSNWRGPAFRLMHPTAASRSRKSASAPSNLTKKKRKQGVPSLARKL
jgi:hypothetical protein